MAEEMSGAELAYKRQSLLQGQSIALASSTSQTALTDQPTRPPNQPKTPSNQGIAFYRAICDVLGGGGKDGSENTLGFEEGDVIFASAQLKDTGGILLFGMNNNHEAGFFSPKHVRPLRLDEIRNEGLENPASLGHELLHAFTERDRSRRPDRDSALMPSSKPSSIYTSEKKSHSSAQGIQSEGVKVSPVCSPLVSNEPPKKATSSFLVSSSPSKPTSPKKAESPSGQVISIMGAFAQERQTWASSVGADFIARSGLTTRQVDRQNTIHEIITTERDYVSDLKIIITVYITGFKKNRLLRVKDLNVIFSNIEQLMPISERLLALFEERKSKAPAIEQIGDIFIMISDYLKIYTMYCSNHPFALAKLRNVSQVKAVKKFLSTCAMSQESKRLDLSTFLLKPVQRICKYPLFLKELLKKTDKAHPDYTNIEKALIKIETVVTIVNEGSKQAEGVMRIVELQERIINRNLNIVSPSRVIVKSGRLMERVSKSEWKKRELVLFNDTFLICKVTDSDALKIIELIPLDVVKIDSLPDEWLDTEEKLIHLFEIIHSGNAEYVFMTQDTKEKEEWLITFKDTILNWVLQKATEIHRSASFSERGSVPVEMFSTAGAGRILARYIYPDQEKASPTGFSAPISVVPSPSITKHSGLEPREHLENSISLDEISVSSTPSYVDNQAAPKILGPSPVSKQLSVTSLSLSTSRSTATTDSHVELISKKTLPRLYSAISSNESSLSSNSLLGEGGKPESSNSLTQQFPQKSADRGFADKVAQSLDDSTLMSGTASKSRSSLSDKKDSRDKSSSATDARDAKTAKLLKSLDNLARTIAKHADIMHDDDSDSPDNFSFKSAGSSTSLIALVPKSLDAEVPRPNPLPPLSNMMVSKTVSPNRPCMTGFKPIKRVLITDVMKLERRVVAVTEEAEERNREAKDLDTSALGDKIYNYVMKVWALGAKEEDFFMVVKNYDDFFELHVNLLGAFPKEAGLSWIGESAGDTTTEDATFPGRLIPDLPAQMVFVSESIAKQRKVLLQAYLNSVFGLPTKISRCPLIKEWFYGGQVLNISSDYSP